MTQNELNREIARRTNETVQTIAEMGFVLLTPQPWEQERERPYMLDWDEVDARRQLCQPV